MKKFKKFITLLLLGCLLITGLGMDNMSLVKAETNLVSSLYGLNCPIESEVGTVILCSILKNPLTQNEVLFFDWGDGRITDAKVVSLITGEHLYMEPKEYTVKLMAKRSPGYDNGYELFRTQVKIVEPPITDLDLYQAFQPFNVSKEVFYSILDEQLNPDSEYTVREAASEIYKLHRQYEEEKEDFDKSIFLDEKIAGLGFAEHIAKKIRDICTDILLTYALGAAEKVIESSKILTKMDKIKDIVSDLELITKNIEFAESFVSYLEEHEQRIVLQGGIEGFFKDICENEEPQYDIPCSYEQLIVKTEVDISHHNEYWNDWKKDNVFYFMEDEDYETLKSYVLTAWYLANIRYNIEESILIFNDEVVIPRVNPSQEKATLTGGIRGEYEDYINGVEVYLMKNGEKKTQSVYTSRYGNYEIHNIPYGTYDVIAYKDGYEMEKSLEVTIPDDETQNVLLYEESGKIKGDIYLPETNSFPSLRGNITRTAYANNAQSQFVASLVSVDSNSSSYDFISNNNGNFVIQDVTPGTYTIAIDDSEYVLEGDKEVEVIAGESILKNLIVRKASTQTPELSDLYFTNETLSKTQLQAGESFDMNFTIKNRGETQMPDVTMVTYYLASEEDFQKGYPYSYMGNYKIETETIPKLMKDGTHDKSFTYTIPEDTPPGTYKVYAWLDSLGYITENNEDNNFRSWEITVEGNTSTPNDPPSEGTDPTPEPPPDYTIYTDLSLGALEVIGTPVPRGRLTVKHAINNLGPKDTAGNKIRYYISQSPSVLGEELGKIEGTNEYANSIYFVPGIVNGGSHQVEQVVKLNTLYNGTNYLTAKIDDSQSGLSDTNASNNTKTYTFQYADESLPEIGSISLQYGVGPDNTIYKREETYTIVSYIKDNLEIKGIDILASYDNGVNWTTLESNYLDDTYVYNNGANYNFQYKWTIPENAPVTDNAYIRLRVKDANGNESVRDTSVLRIVDGIPPQITLQSPSSGEQWAIGTTKDIVFESSKPLKAGFVSINYGGSVSYKMANFPLSENRVSYTIPLKTTYITDQAKILFHVMDEDYNWTDYESPYFSVVRGTLEIDEDDPVVEVLSPSEDGIIFIDSDATISWKVTDSSDLKQVTVYMQPRLQFTETLSDENLAEGSITKSFAGYSSNTNAKIIIEATDIYDNRTIYYRTFQILSPDDLPPETYEDYQVKIYEETGNLAPNHDFEWIEDNKAVGWTYGWKNSGYRYSSNYGYTVSKTYEVLSDYIQVDPNKPYKFSAFYKAFDNPKFIASLYYYDENKNYKNRGEMYNGFLVGGWKQMNMSRMYMNNAHYVRIGFQRKYGVAGTEVIVDKIFFGVDEEELAKNPPEEEPQSCLSVYDPVCGSDGETYSNACYAGLEGITEYTQGECLPPEPVIIDTDLDSIADENDNCSAISNVDQLDKDSDGIGDVCDTDNDNDGVNDDTDNCLEIVNSDQADRDNDGIGDVCDSDNDNDGVNDDTDNCAEIANADQKDFDVDGVGDVCDEDIDGDTILNDTDNCSLLSNTEQHDKDSDGIGDACDEDNDNDGVDDDADNCPEIFNANQADMDSDGIGDVCDDTDDRVASIFVTKTSAGNSYETEITDVVYRDTYQVTFDAEAVGSDTDFALYASYYDENGNNRMSSLVQQQILKAGERKTMTFGYRISNSRYPKMALRFKVSHSTYSEEEGLKIRDIQVNKMDPADTRSPILQKGPSDMMYQKSGTPFVFEMIDTDSGINPDTITLDVNINNTGTKRPIRFGSIESTYNVSLDEITNGYALTYTPGDEIQSGDKVYMCIEFKDYAGNKRNAYYNFFMEEKVPTNELANADFEIIEGEKALYWFDLQNNEKLSVNTTDAQSGSSSLKMENSAYKYYKIYSDPFTVVGNKKYILSFHAKGNIAQRFTMKAISYDTKGKKLQESYLLSLNNTEYADWEKIEKLMTIPYGAAFTQIMIESYAYQANTLLLDNFSMAENTDYQKPVLSNVVLSDNIQFDVVDEGIGLDTTSGYMRLYRNGTYEYIYFYRDIDGVERTDIQYGYSVKYTPSVSFVSGESIPVFIYVRDKAGNTVYQSLNLTVE